jgi:hypothetical protein
LLFKFQLYICSRNQDKCKLMNLKQFTRQIAFLLVFFLPGMALAQSTITGEVRNEKGEPLSYVSVFIVGTTEGTLTDAAGKFTITTNLTGNQQFVANLTGYTKVGKSLDLAGGTYTLAFSMKQTETYLEGVTITAGTIEANNERSVAVLKPLDIVTTAGAQGDIIGAIQTLPGVQRNGGDQTGLMVRGGDVSESIMIVDGTVAQNAFNSSVPGVAQRSRFNTFKFK